MRTLVLVHGRSQQGKDPVALKQTWLDSLHKGLDAAGLTLDLPDEKVRFPYYGNVLARLVEGEEDAGDIIVQGSGDIDAPEKAFIGAAIADAVKTAGVPDQPSGNRQEATMSKRGRRTGRGSSPR